MSFKSSQEKRQLNYSLREAYERKDLQSVERIVQNFPDPKYAHNNRIYCAIGYGDETEVESLIGYASTDVNWINEAYFGWSFLHQAANFNKVSTLKMILQHGGDANLQDVRSQTPIFYCTSSQAIQLLLDNGAHLEHKDESGNTPIHLAARWNKVDVLSKLISHGAALDARNNARRTALDLAKIYNSHTCIKLLEEAMKKEQENTKLEVQKYLDEPDNSQNKAITKKQEEALPDDIKREIFKQDETIPDTPFSPEIQTSLISALKEGSGNANVCLILMHGAPAVGKSSVCRILQGLPPLPKPQQHSTAMFEDPVRLIKTDRFSVTSEAVLKHVDEIEIMEMIASHVYEKEKERKAETQPQPSTKSENRDKNAETQPPTSIVQPVSSETSPAKKHPTSQPMSDVIRAIAKLKKDGISSSDLFKIAWFHIMDSGGQPQFTDVLPLMFPIVSLHLVVIRLDEKLDDKPMVRYLVAGENKYKLPENLALSNLQMIQRTCELAEATRISTQGKVCPWVMVIATHLDCESSEESLKEKNRRLQDLADKYNCILTPKSKDEVIFAMNAMAPEGKERNEYTRLLQQHVLQAPKVHTKDVQVPARWMLFHLELSRCSKEGVVEKSVCLEVGDRIQMHEDDAMSAVKYFDSVALHKYLPGKLPDLIFTKFDPIVSRLSEVLAASFTLPSAGPIGEDRRKLRTTGILRKKFVEELFRGKFNPHPFSVDMFFALLEYLRIADQIEKDTYFIPCVLPLDDPNPVKFITECSPALLTWDENVLPQGFFPALIVQLLRRKSAPHFRPSSGEKQLRRAVYLNSPDGALLVVDQTSWFELYFAGEILKFPLMLEAVEESSRRLANRMKIHGYGELTRGVRCPRVSCDAPFIHPGIILPQSNMAECTEREAYRFELSPEQNHWFKSTSGASPDGKQSHNSTPSNKSEDDDAVHQTDINTSVSQTLGTGSKDVQFVQAHTKMSKVFLMNRTHEDTIESQLSLKKPNLDIQEPLQTSLYGHSKPGKLRAVNVCGETSVKVIGDNGKCIDWPEYGFKMEIPPGALLPDDNCTIEIKAITAGHFNIPQHSEVVSAFYWIYSSRKFLKPVDVQLQHCARLSSEGDCSQMQFIIARCDQKELPYKFSIKNGVFSANNQQGLISLTKFSIIGIIRSIVSYFLVEPTDYIPRPHNSCYYVIRVFGRKVHSQNTWEFDIIITKDIHPYLKAIDCNYHSRTTSWIEDIPPASIEFQDEIISISPQLEDLHQGWRYVCKYTQNIKKSFVDRCEENTTQQSCRIAFCWEGNGEPLPMDCRVHLQGAVDTPKLTLMLPTENPTNECNSSDIKDVDILSRRPELAELENHVRTNKWHAVGLQLHLEENDLVAIEREYRGDIASCRRSMFDLWLKTFPEASRKQLLDGLKSKAVAEIHMAEQYRECICHQLSQTPTPSYYQRFEVARQTVETETGPQKRCLIL